MSSLPLSALPALNAALNATCAVLLISGYLMIRRRKVLAHKICMGSAYAVAVIFLASYLTYHSQVGSMSFGSQGWIRPVYFTLLTSHTILAARSVPLVLVTLSRARRGRFDRHVNIARWTRPRRLFVSVTRVVVYFMLYHLCGRV